MLFVGFLLLMFPSTAKGQVKINEILVDGSPEWVEFHNASESADFIKEYYLDDDSDFNSDSGSSDKKLLTGLNTSNATYVYIELNSFFNNDGDKVVLFSPDGQIVDQYEYVQNPGADRSLGRKPDANGSFYKLTSQTKGSANADIYNEPQPSPSPSPSPSASPSLSPSPSPIPSPSPSPSKKPSPSPARLPSPSPQRVTSSDEETLVRGETLGIGTSTSPSPEAGDDNTPKKFPIVAVSLIAGGLALVGLASYLFFRSFQKEKAQGRVQL